MYEIIATLLESLEFREQVIFNIKKFKANELILSQGKKHEHVYLIKSGGVRVTIHAEIDDELKLKPGIAELGPKEIFGEFGLFDDLPASADVKTTFDSELIEIDIPSFKVFLAENPQIGYNVFSLMLQTLVKRLRGANKAIYKLYIWGMKAHQLDKYLE